MAPSAPRVCSTSWRWVYHTPFGSPVVPGGVERRRAGALVERREVVTVPAAFEQGLVGGRELEAVIGRRRGVVVAHEHKLRHAVEPPADLCDQRDEILVHEDDVVLRVVDGVEDLIGREPHVDGMQHCAHHRDREEAFEIPGRVPVHHRDRRAALDTEGGEPRREAPDASPQLAVAVPASGSVDDLARRRDGQRAVQQVVEGERIVVGLGGDDQIVRSHVRSLPVR